MDPKLLDQIESAKETDTNFQNSVIRTKLVIDYSRKSTTITRKDKVLILIQSCIGLLILLVIIAIILGGWMIWNRIRPSINDIQVTITTNNI